MNLDSLIREAWNPAALTELGDVLVRGPSSFMGTSPDRALLAVTPGLPFALAGGYVLMVFGGQALMKMFSPISMRPIVAAWNLFLAIFSVLGALVLVPHALKILGNYGKGYSLDAFKSHLCHPAEDTYDGIAGYWTLLFVFSKPVELVDTLLLILQKKPVIFLHWYHHFTVMLYCWFGWTWLRSTAGLYFGAMNFSVHAIMYSYYFLMTFKVTRSIVKPVAPVITTLQITQMVFGVVISYMCFEALKLGAEKNLCTGLDGLHVQLGTGMYVSYFILFAILFRKMYFGGGRKKTTDNKKKSKKE